MPNASGDLKKRKKAIRAEVLAARNAIPAAERARRGEAIAERLVALADVVEASTVMVFSSFGSEVDTDPIIERLAARGARVLLPRLADREMHAVAYAPGDPVTTAPFGAREPRDGESVDPREIDVVVTPGLAFDRHGNRVGYGGGFYDRFLMKTRSGVPRVGLCFALQVLDEVPRGRTDQPVTRIVTEEGLIECR